MTVFQDFGLTGQQSGGFLGCRHISEKVSRNSRSSMVGVCQADRAPPEGTWLPLVSIPLSFAVTVLGPFKANLSFQILTPVRNGATIRE